MPWPPRKFPSLILPGDPEWLPPSDCTLSPHRMMMAAGGGVPYATRAVAPDGTTDFGRLAADFTGGGGTGQDLLFSAWVNFSASSEDYLISGDTAGPDIYVGTVASNGKFYIKASNTGNGDVILGYTSALNDSAWHHILFAADLGATTLQGYVDDSSDITVTTASGTIDYSDSAWDLFGQNSGGVNKFVGSCADIYLAFEYLDISVESNRRKFIDALGKPVSLGADGSGPTGTQPIGFWKLNDGDAAATFYTNKGSGGGMTEDAGGSLAEAGSSPSD